MKVYQYKVIDRFIVYTSKPKVRFSKPTEIGEAIKQREITKSRLHLYRNVLLNKNTT